MRLHLKFPTLECWHDQSHSWTETDIVEMVSHGFDRHFFCLTAWLHCKTTPGLVTALQDNSWPCDCAARISAIDHIYTHFADNRCKDTCIDCTPSLVYRVVVAAVNTVIWMMPLCIRCSRSMVCQ